MEILCPELFIQVCHNSCRNYGVLRPKGRAFGGTVHCGTFVYYYQGGYGAL